MLIAGELEAQTPVLKTYKAYLMFRRECAQPKNHDARELLSNLAEQEDLHTMIYKFTTMLGHAHSGQLSKGFTPCRRAAHGASLRAGF